MSEHEDQFEDVPEGVDPMTGEVTEPGTGGPNADPGEQVDVPQVDDDPDQDEGADDAEPAAAADAAPHDARDDREIEAIYKRLDTRAANYIKSAAEIVGNESVPLEVCEMCKDGYPGLRWAEPQDELHANLLNVVTEEEQGAPLRVDPNAQVCEVCDGFGMVKLPSHVPNNQVRVCRTCNGAGYRELNPQSGTPVAPSAQPENGHTEQMPGVPLDDPVIADLIARNYTIIPPMTFTGGES